MTKKLFWDDMYLARSSANIIEVKNVDGKYHVLTDSTIFYPGGGGFPKDRGKINGIPVLDVYEDDQNIWHVLDTAIDEPQVFMEIDFQHRYDFMQQHTSQHLLSAIVKSMNGGDTLSMHLGENYSSIDVNVPPDSIDIVSIEIEMLIIISQARPVVVRYYKRGEKLPPTRKPLKWEKIKGDMIRIVEIAGIDISACGGLHVRSTSELAPMILIPKVEKYKGGSRIYFYAGYRSYSMIDDYRKEINDLKEKLEELITENKRLNKILISYRVSDIWKNASVVDTKIGSMIIILVDDPDIVVNVAKARPKDLDKPLLVIGGERFTFVGPDKLWENIRPYVRGGGKKGSFSGKVLDKNGLKNLLGVEL